MQKIKSLIKAKIFDRSLAEETDDVQVLEEQETEITPKNILFLGTGGSGKSSFIRKVYHSVSGHSTNQSHLVTIQTNVIEMVPNMEEMVGNLTSKRNQDFFNKLFTNIVFIGTPTCLKKRAFECWSEQGFPTSYVSLFWDSGFQDKLRNAYTAATFDKIESARYFMKMSNFERVLKSGKEEQLTVMDLGSFHLKTVGVYGTEFLQYKLIDTGGQRNERRKYTKELETGSISMVCFMVDLSDFDLTCYEGVDDNRLKESLEFFDKWFNDDLVKQLPCYLIFTKLNVLERKVNGGVKLSQYCENYHGDDSDVEQVRQFIMKQFLDIDVGKRLVKYFTISCTDIENQVNIANEMLGRPQRSNVGQIAKLKKKKQLKKKKIHQKYELIMIEDIICSILKFFPLDELLEIYSNVSKLWRNACFKAPIGLRRPNLKLFVENSSFENVTSLNLQSCLLREKDVELLIENSKFRQLRYLNVSNNYLLSTKEWSKLLDSQICRELSTLIIEYCELQSVDFLMKNERLKLEMLSLSGNSQLPVLTFEIMANAPVMKHLKKIFLFNVRIDRSVHRLINVLPNLQIMDSADQ